MAINTECQLSYFQTSVGTLSAVGLHNVLVSLIIAGIINGFPFLLLVPTLTSAASALANGLCYYVFFTDYPVVNRAVAAGFMDTFWFIQEAGLPFYGYAIVTNVSHGVELRIFRTIFWALMLVTFAVRIVITVFDVGFITDPSSIPRYNTTVNLLHIGYFVPITLAECLTAALLLKKFRRAWRVSQTSKLKASLLYHYIMRSTEIRVSMLTIIGIWRTITFSTHTFGNQDRLATQFDQFAYMLATFFPMIMFVDIIASRLVYADGCSMRSSNLKGTPNQPVTASVSSSQPQHYIKEGHAAVDITETEGADRGADNVIYGWNARNRSGSNGGGKEAIEPEPEQHEC